MGDSEEYREYKKTELWEPLPGNEMQLVKELINPENPLSKLFLELYSKTSNLYKKIDARKDGTDPFTHPLNVVWDLHKANIEDYVTLCAGLTHDYIEEKVDLHMKKKNLTEKNIKDIKRLDRYETRQFNIWKKQLIKFSTENDLEETVVSELININRLLTRHKRHLYYCSISEIFNCSDEKIKRKAIRVKLADRIHNIQCLENFSAEGKLYQCFKNIFILNNTKSYLIELFGEDRETEDDLPPLEKLFKKCSKSTFDAFNDVIDSLRMDIPRKVRSEIQLAFGKYVHERDGLTQVTEHEMKKVHPMNTYEGIVEKYDTRLHHEWTRLNLMKSNEENYFKTALADHKFNDDEIKSIITYKDAYALKEVVLALLYKKNHVIKGFGCDQLCKRRKVCMRQGD